MVILRSLVTTGAIFLYGLQEAYGAITCPEIFQTPGLCLSDNNELQGGNKLTCTAGDIEKAEGDEAKLEVKTITTGCTGPDSTVTFTADLTYTVSGGATRYDIGLYVASDADANGDVGNCNIFSFGCQDTLPEDGDLCGDRDGFNTEQGLQITAACVVNAEGKFEVPYCFSYSQRIADVTCTDATGGVEGNPQPFQAIPGAPAKCQCDSFDLGDQVCSVTLNQNADELQPLCTDDGLTDIVIAGADIDFTGAGDTFEYEISPGNGPQAYSAGENIEILNPFPDTTYTIVVRRTNDPNVPCEDTFEITTEPCGPDTCDGFSDCEPGFSVTDPDAECVDAALDPTDCTNAICCDQDTCASFTAGCAAGTSPVDGTVPCEGECTAATCCDQESVCGTGYACADGFGAKDDQASIVCEDTVCDDDDCCDAQNCDTSFGCTEVDGDSCASPKLNEVPGVKANRWGWYTEEIFSSTDQQFTFDMYAGAGQNVLANGAYAGNVIVTVNEHGVSSYEVYPADGYCFDDIHVHVGNELPTTTKKKATTITVAPGQYTQAESLHDGTFYIIVHVGETCTPCEH